MIKKYVNKKIFFLLIFLIGLFFISVSGAKAELCFGFYQCQGNQFYAPGGEYEAEEKCKEHCGGQDQIKKLCQTSPNYNNWCCECDSCPKDTIALPPGFNSCSEYCRSKDLKGGSYSSNYFKCCKCEFEISSPPIMPILSVIIPGLNLTGDPKALRVCVECVEPVESGSECPDGKCLRWTYQIPWIGQYISAFYKWAIGAIAVLAVLMIVVAGFRMVVAGGNAEKVKGARDSLFAAVIGLLFMLIVHQVLAMINPDLVIFKPIIIGSIKRIELDNEELGFSEVSFPSGHSSNCPDINVRVGATCSSSDIVNIARSFLGQNSGPCHCVCFVSRVLKAANCKLPSLFTSVSGLENWLNSNGWEKYDVGKDIVTKQAKSGDIVAYDGHIGISLGNGQIIDSGTIKKGKTENGCTLTSTTCPNVWHGLNNSDGRRDWSSDKCISNQTIKTRANFFTRYWSK